MSFRSAEHFAPNLARGAGQSAQQKYGVGGNGPMSDLQTRTPFAGTMGATGRDMAMNQITHDLGMSDLTFGSQSGTREMEGFMNQMQMEGRPVIVERLIIDNYMGPDAPHFRVLPPKRMNLDEVGGRTLKTIRLLEYWPEETPEFVPPAYQGYKVSEFTQYPRRYTVGYRIPGDIVFTPQGKRLDEGYQASIASVMNKNAAAIITAALMSVQDRYRMKRSDMSIGQMSSSEMHEKNMSYQGPMNNGSILASPGFVGVANRYNGIEWMLAWSRRVSSQHGVQPNFIFKNAGIFENEAFRAYRTQYANRGDEANANLNGGEDAMNQKVLQKFPNITVIDEPTYEPANMPNEQMQILSTNAQFGRYNFLDNDVYKDKLSCTDAAEYGKQCGSGAWRANDLYYLDLSGDGDIECHRYDDLVRAAICFDKSGRLNTRAYDELLHGPWKEFARTALGIKVTDESRFKIDPWIVREKNRNRLVRIVGNQDLYHTDINTTRTILTAACRSVYHSSLGEEGARNVGKLVDWMRRNRMASYDTEGNMGAFWTALAWENVDPDQVPDNGVAVVHELQKTKGGVRPPRVTPLVTTRGEYSSRYVTFTTVFGGDEYVLLKVPSVSQDDGTVEPLSGFVQAAGGAEAGPQAQPPANATARASRLAERFPQYVWTRTDLFNRAMFDENARRFVEGGTGIRSVDTTIGTVPLEGVRPALWPRTKNNGAVMPGFSTFSNVNTLVHMMYTTEDVNGWADILGEKQLTIIREGFETAMNYARTVESIFSPRGDSGSTLDANLFFRESMLPAYQRDEDDRRTNELMAFLQNAVGGVAPELGIVSPFLITGQAGGARDLMTPRFGQIVGVTRGNGNQTRSNLPGMYNVGPGGGERGSTNVQALTNILFPSTVGGQQPSYTRRQARRVLHLFGYDMDDDEFATADAELTRQIATQNTALNNFTDADLAKKIVVVGYMLHGLQTGTYEDMREYLLLSDVDAETTVETVDQEPWISFRRKWYDTCRYERGSLQRTLQLIVDSIVNRISDDQFINLMNREQGANFRDLNILLNVPLDHFSTLINSVNAYAKNVTSGSREKPPKWARLQGDNDTPQSTVAEKHQNVVRIIYDETAAAMSPSARETERVRGRNDPGRAPRGRVASMEALYTFLEGQSRVTNVVGLGVSIDKSYFDSAERVARESVGQNMPRGLGAALTLVRPASISEPGEFAGAPPLANVRGNTAATRDRAAQLQSSTYEHLYDEIRAHGGACHGQATYLHSSMKAMPVYSGVGVGVGRGHYGKRHRQPTDYGYGHYQYGGSHYERASESSSSSSSSGLPPRVDAASELVGSRRRQRFDDGEEDEAMEDVLGNMIPGVHADELPNSHFYHRINVLKDSVEHKWEMRSLLYAYLGAVPTAQLMCRLHEAGIPAPMTLLVMEPFIDFRMRAIMLVQGGADLGYLGYTLNLERKGFDPHRTIFTTHVSSVMGAFIDRPEWIQIFPYAAFDRVVRGGQMRLVENFRTQMYDDIDNNCDWDAEDPLNRKDAFVVHCGGSTTRKHLPTHIPLTGGIDGRAQYRFFGDRVIETAAMPNIKDNHQAYPSAILTNLVAQFHVCNQNTPEHALVPDNAQQLREPVGTHENRTNMWVSQACQWQHNPNNPAEPVLRARGYGPIGNAGPGDAAVFNGKPVALSSGVRDRGLLVSAAS